MGAGRLVLQKWFQRQLKCSMAETVARTGLQRTVSEPKPSRGCPSEIASEMLPLSDQAASALLTSASLQNTTHKKTHPRCGDHEQCGSATGMCLSTEGNKSGVNEWRRRVFTAERQRVSRSISKVRSANQFGNTVRKLFRLLNQ